MLKMESKPIALILASQEDVLSHGHVLYGLVKGGQDGKSVESTSRMVNVVPRKRIYCMDSVDELMQFREELMKRPLVIQPIIQAGTGIQSLDCFFCVKKEINVYCYLSQNKGEMLSRVRNAQQKPWVVMVNQFHEKVMDKISAGMDMAKRSMFRGEPYVLEFSFGDILKRHYYGNMAKYMSTKYTYTDCEYGDVIIRSSNSQSFGNKVAQFRFSFEDVAADEIYVRTIEEAAKEKRSPVLEFIPQSELKEMLPSWVFDEVEVEESIVSTSDYHSDTNAGATGGEVVTSQPRVLGRSQRKPPLNTYEVPVDLHVPNGVCENISEPNNETKYATDSDHEYEIGRYRHFHQGSGRSDSSIADSGYEDIVVHDDKTALHKNKPKNKKRGTYDNYGFNYNGDDEDYGPAQNNDPEVYTIITRTGKKTFTSVDKESSSARMMDESYM